LKIRGNLRGEKFNAAVQKKNGWDLQLPFIRKGERSGG